MPEPVFKNIANHFIEQYDDVFQLFRPKPQETETPFADEYKEFAGIKFQQVEERPEWEQAKQALTLPPQPTALPKPKPPDPKILDMMERLHTSEGISQEEFRDLGSVDGVVNIIKAENIIKRELKWDESVDTFMEGDKVRYRIYTIGEGLPPLEGVMAKTRAALTTPISGYIPLSITDIAAIGGVGAGVVVGGKSLFDSLFNQAARKSVATTYQAIYNRPIPKADLNAFVRMAGDNLKTSTKVKTVLDTALGKYKFPASSTQITSLVQQDAKSISNIADQLANYYVQQIPKFSAVQTGVPAQTLTSAQIIQSIQGTLPGTAQAIQAGVAQLTPEVPPTQPVVPIAEIIETAHQASQKPLPFRATEWEKAKHLQGLIIEKLGSDPTITLYRGSRKAGLPLQKPLVEPRLTEVGAFWTTDIEIARTYGENIYKVDIKASELANSSLADLVGGTEKEFHLMPTLQSRAELVKPPQDIGQARVNEIQEQGRINPEKVTPEDSKYAHIEMVSPDGPQPPKPPLPPTGAPKEPGDIFKNIIDKATKGERIDQTFMRLYGGAVRSMTRRTNITINKGSQSLKKLGVGEVKLGQVVPRERDIPILDSLYIALHNPSKVDTGEIIVPKGYEAVYRELRELADWDTASGLDFDPNMATIDDWFFRGWKPPEGMYGTQRGALATKPKALRTPRIDASYQELRELGFEPLFWNPYQQWGYRHALGEVYHTQMELVSYLKGMGDEFIRPVASGSLPEGWKVPRVGPAFEGRPFSAVDPATGEPAVMITRRWTTPTNVANSLENVFGRKPNLGKLTIGKKTIDPLAIIDFLTFLPKRAKLFASFFQQIDFLTRAGSGSWTGMVDQLMAGKPVKSLYSVTRFPKTAVDILKSNFSPSARLKLSEHLDSTKSLVQGRPGVHLKGISEAGLSTMDVTIFPDDMDKLVRKVAENTGLMGMGKRMVDSVVGVESAMRRGLFQGVYPAAITTDIEKNIAPAIARQFPNSTDEQINGMIAKVANIKYSVIPPEQSVFQNPMLREVLRRVFFSVGESEGLLRQATGALHGTNAKFWRKHWLGVYLFLIFTANLIHFASTGEPLPKERYTPISKDSWGPLPFGYNTKFASPNLPFEGRGDVELTMDLAGQMDTAFRVLDPGFFLESRTSVPLRAIANQFTGTDFYGAPIDDVGPGGVTSRTTQLILDLFSPIGVGGIAQETMRQTIPGAEDIIPRGEDRLGMLGLGLQATGINIRAEGTVLLLDRYAKESGFRKADGTVVQQWSDLEPSQKDKLLEDEKLVEELSLRSKTSVERGYPGAQGFGILEELDQQRIDRGEALATEFNNEDIDANTFREEFSKLKAEISAKKSQVDEDFQLFKETDKLPEDPNKRALVEYYAIFDKAKRASGVVDWDKVDELEARLRARWTRGQEAYVDRNIGLTKWGPLIQEYIDAQKTLKESGYWDIEDPNQSRKRLDLRRQNPRIDAILQKWYGYKPVEGRDAGVGGGMAWPGAGVGGGGSLSWPGVRGQLNSSTLSSLNDMWYRGGSLSGASNDRLHSLWSAQSGTKPTYSTWVKQSLRQSYENSIR